MAPALHVVIQPNVLSLLMKTAGAHPRTPPELKFELLLRARGDGMLHLEQSGGFGRFLLTE